MAFMLFTPAIRPGDRVSEPAPITSKLQHGAIRAQTRSHKETQSVGTVKRQENVCHQIHSPTEQKSVKQHGGLTVASASDSDGPLDPQLFMSEVNNGRCFLVDTGAQVFVISPNWSSATVKQGVQHPVCTTGLPVHSQSRRPAYDRLAAARKKFIEMEQIGTIRKPCSP
ncbi:transposon Ty3-G Gag-Pol polyprotein [Elysia marginata]|uniref:Transposon Ty3-G Gag-Pol polyprotein n=1 Tax=Elysia marginata TaxID=1093978 RepID=A0AAV4F455_9GAST|nr:transposon Ty3-G Gag-Pol polyprotein [Elysia marginata]